MAPAAKAFLVSGYPRNMRDVVEYSNKARTITTPSLYRKSNRKTESILEIYLPTYFLIFF